MEKETALPKNVRQIGDIQGNKRIYMEDYVATYIHRKEKQEETGGFLGVFLGERQKSDKETRLFVRGLMNISLDRWDEKPEEKKDKENKKTAESEESSHLIQNKKQAIEPEQENPAEELPKSEEADTGTRGRKKLQSIELWQEKFKAGKKLWNSQQAGSDTEDTEMEASWENNSKDETEVLNEISLADKKPEKKTIPEECREYFGDWEILGCCVIGRYPVEAMKQLMQEVPQTRRFLYHLQEQEEHLYWTDTGRYEEVTGYFVFYEQNRNMQEYIAQSLKEKTDAKEKITDQAIQTFREKIRKKDQMRSAGMMKLASSFFAVTVLVIGAVVVTRVGNIRDTGDAVQSEIDRLEDTSVVSSSVSTSISADAGVTGSENASDGNVAGNTGVESTAGTTGSTGVESTVEMSGSTGAESTASGNTAAESDTATSGSSGAESTTASAETAGNTVTESATAAADSTVADDTAAASVIAADQSAAELSDDVGADSTATAQSAAELSDDVGADSIATAQSAAESSVTAADSTATATSDSITTAASTSASDDIEAASVRQTMSSYVIREGDTLADICQKYYGSLNRLEELCQTNGIEDANLIMPGQKIVLP
jgi:hypothetical protein